MQPNVSKMLQHAIKIEIIKYHILAFVQTDVYHIIIAHLN